MDCGLKISLMKKYLSKLKNLDDNFLITSIVEIDNNFSRILTFVFLIALFYQIIKYEDKNELLIFWNNGINKFKFINSIITYSFLIVILQIILGSLMSPIGQNLARQEIADRIE